MIIDETRLSNGTLMMIGQDYGLFEENNIETTNVDARLIAKCVVSVIQAANAGLFTDFLQNELDI